VFSQTIKTSVQKKKTGKKQQQKNKKTFVHRALEWSLE
jgi:hypothetical protein